MEPRTSRSDYAKHLYSGPRKNANRVRAQIKRFHGEIKSRSELWCKKRKSEDNPNVPSSSILESETSSDVDDDLPENSLETEKNLHASAIKNNLDEVSVKKILKKVVTNDHVLALVKLREEQDAETEEGLSQKFTRAKAKELKKVSTSATPGVWPFDLKPIKGIPVKTTPEVTALIAQELPDDEDDEEYKPTHDDIPSDDDHILESSSDLDSLPRTPATPKSQTKDSPVVVKDGPFKVPQEVTTPTRNKLNLEEEATIALRTRSKLSLSATPIEHIESSFIPPDDLPVPDVDDLWNQFLTECLNPGANARNEDDDELDPEYNVAADPDANEEEEALEKSIVKISKRELSELVAELMTVMPAEINQLTDNAEGDLCAGNSMLNIMDPASKKLECMGLVNNTEVPMHWEGKQEPVSDDETQCTSMSKLTFETSNRMPHVSIGKMEIEDNEGTPDVVYNTDQTVLPAEEAVGADVPTTVASNVAINCSGSRTLKMLVEERDLFVTDCPSSPANPPPPLLKLLAPAPQTVNIIVDQSLEVSPEQVSILQQQVRQHVQLSVSNYLQLYVHPLHWTYAPYYKGYLESFCNIVKSNQRSVLNVCNLTPAMELVTSWEKSVSENTQENQAMVKFIHKETEKCRRRTAGHNMYVGNFPELFKKVIANSQVFLYPYLLPPMPYRSINTIRRFNYLKSEDRLIVLGVDQFLWYVENNPKYYKPPNKLHPRRRWGLATTVALVCKHMFPWMTPKGLMGHIQNVKKAGEKSNPIVKYFENKTIEPVKHTILPFNPKMTLYEHPEIEMPRIWIKYLAMSSERFKSNSSRRYDVVQPPTGVEVQVGSLVEPMQKQPLPIDFTKPISCTRANILPKAPKPITMDKVDVHINSAQDVATDANFLLAANLYTLVNTSTGTQLLPLKIVQTATVDCASAPIPSPIVIQNNSAATNLIPNGSVDDTDNNNTTKQNTDTDKPKETKNSIHCTCCTLLRKLSKNNQALITDYFKPKRDKRKEACECSGKRYPKITNKLKLFVNNYKNLSAVVYTELLHKMKVLDGQERCDGPSTDFTYDDFASAISFQTKLLVRTGVIRNYAVKNALHVAFSKFDVESGDPVLLAEKLFKIFDVELVDMYKEFLGFLTAEQADRMGQFNEYFIRNCVEDLIKKIEEQVSDLHKRRFMLKQIKASFASKSCSPCEICFNLLLSMHGYPELARYVFSLFPHRRKGESEHDADSHHTPSVCDVRNGVTDDAEGMCELTESVCAQTGNMREETNAAVDYEVETSCSEDELQVDMDYEIDIEPERADDDERVHLEYTTIKYEPIETIELTITKTEVQEKSDSSDMSMLIISEGESIKTEPLEWTREEDKLILETLKQYLTPEEWSDKTITDIIKEKDLLNIITNRLSHKSLEDVTERVLYVLQILVLSDSDR